MPSATTLTPVLDRLRDGERAQVLHELLDRHPQLRSEAEQVSIELLREVTVDAVTDRVAGRLTGLELADLAARAGRVPGGYVEPGEAASALVEEALAPVESDLRRCIDLGLRQAARQILLGLVTGMHRCSDPPEGTVLAHAGPDTLTEHATWLVDQMQQAGLELDADELQERCPGGGSDLTATSRGNRGYGCGVETGHVPIVRSRRSDSPGERISAGSRIAAGATTTFAP